MHNRDAQRRQNAFIAFRDQYMGGYNAKRLFSSCLIQFRSRLHPAMQLDFVSHGENVAYRSKPKVCHTSTVSAPEHA
jgi:hypothetical protein